jgi:hypothetical protein
MNQIFGASEKFQRVHRCTFKFKPSTAAISTSCPFSIAASLVSIPILAFKKHLSARSIDWGKGFRRFAQHRLDSNLDRQTLSTQSLKDTDHKRSRP